MTFGNPTQTSTVTATGDNNIDGLIIGVRWSDPRVTFSFPDSIDDYESGYLGRADHAVSFQTLNATQRAVTRAWLGPGGASSFYSVSMLNPIELAGVNDRDATVRMAMSSVYGTGYGYYPNSFTVEGGDTWFNDGSTQDGIKIQSPVIGTYGYHTFGHELGHALGLKEGHKAGGVRNVAMNADRDSMEFSIMTYRSYVGHDLTALPYYTNGSGSFAQSLMMYDIAAIQHLYGAWFGYNSGDTTYSFSTDTGEMFVRDGTGEKVGQGVPFVENGEGKIFRTIWDGGGNDTYDFSNYTKDLSVDLTPGRWVDLDVNGNLQRAYLRGGDGGGLHPGYARAHIFNALQYQGNPGSLIENAVGGSGNDVIIGNSANNNLSGSVGNDILNGYGNTDAEVDTLQGGMGRDDFILGGSWGVSYLGNGYAIITDWEWELDSIEVKGSASDYSLSFGTFGVGSQFELDTGIYYSANNSSDLIAVVQDSTNVQIPWDFKFV